uniref:Uncharacterized protein n=1 Tax=Solanum tuberosum TaxID=4113 RepID=M1DZU0_SOLTU
MVRRAIRRTSSSSVTLGDPTLHHGTVRHMSTRFSIADLIFSFRVWHTGTLGEIIAIRRLAQWIRRSTSFLFFVLSAALFLFAH